MRKRGIAVLFSVLFILLIFSVYAQSIDAGDLVKVSLHKGESISKTISLSSDSPGEYILELVSIPDASLSEDKLFFKEKGSKQVILNFNSSKLEPKSYVGGIKILKGEEVSFIPVVFEVESREVLLDLNLDVPPQSSEILPGGKFTSQLKIYDLTSGGTSIGLGSVTVEVTYYIAGIDGSLLSSEKEIIVLNKQVQMLKIVSLPASIKEGDYVFSAVVKYQDSVGVSSYLFRVSNELNNKNSRRLSLNAFYLIFGMLMALFAVVLVLILRIMREKDEHILELEAYNSDESSIQKEILMEQQKFLMKKGELSGEVKQEVKEKIANLKEKHEKRIKDINKLKKQGSVEVVKKKLKEWKKERKKILSESKISALSRKDMDEIERKFKK